MGEKRAHLVKFFLSNAPHYLRGASFLYASKKKFAKRHEISLEKNFEKKF